MTAKTRRAAANVGGFFLSDKGNTLQGKNNTVNFSKREISTQFYLFARQRQQRKLREVFPAFLIAFLLMLYLTCLFKGICGRSHWRRNAGKILCIAGDALLTIMQSLDNRLHRYVEARLHGRC